jgi:hypothetical protein
MTEKSTADSRQPLATYAELPIARATDSQGIQENQLGTRCADSRIASAGRNVSFWGAALQRRIDSTLVEGHGPLTALTELTALVA